MPFTSPNRGGSPPPPLRERAAHSAKLESAIARAISRGRRALAERDPDVATGSRGLYLQFELSEGGEAALDSLENKQKKIELVSVKSEVGELPTATVFVPEASAEYFLGRVQSYGREDTESGKPKHAALVARLENARLATVRSLFTDPALLFPRPRQRVWWEVWLREGAMEQFKTTAAALDVSVKAHSVRFPEREVVLALADRGEVGRILLNTDAIAELRIARDTPTFFLDLPAFEQAEWTADLQRRLVPSTSSIAVCLLDTGVTRAHPLLERSVASSDMHTVEAAWGVNDVKGHGTQMAGLCLLGDLTELLVGSASVSIAHVLESVKILQSAGDNDRNLYGAITLEGISRAELQSPTRKRVICMAVTSSFGTRNGHPSSWSAALDQAAYAAGEAQRLIVVSAGNIRDDVLPSQYPSRNDLEVVESPAQSWNALSVGASTDKINIVSDEYHGWTALAPAGDLSPTSRTSVLWESQWPLKPDVVFEGGNLGTNGSGPAQKVDDLQLLTTHHQPLLGLFARMSETSASTALVSRMAAQVLAERPTLWPETVRALVVHSADWTSAMRGNLAWVPSVQDKRAFLRRYGYGVPSLERAVLSARNDLTLVIEDELAPFKKDGSIKTNEMNFHEFPWSRVDLAELRDAEVELRVTLSYFIEPNPGERGWTKRHRYASHGLRFEVKGALESDARFRRRVNAEVALDDGGLENSAPTGNDEWLLGPKVRNVGSIHSDVWRGSAAAFAQRTAIGVYPVGGWWREIPKLERWTRRARYALVVSIRVPSADVDIYTPIANAIRVSVDIAT